MHADGQTPFILKRKVIGVLFLRDWSPTDLLCREIPLEFSVSCLRGVATLDPWNTSSSNYHKVEFQGSGKRTSHSRDCQTCKQAAAVLGQA